MDSSIIEETVTTTIVDTVSNTDDENPNEVIINTTNDEDMNNESNQGDLSNEVLIQNNGDEMMQAVYNSNSNNNNNNNDDGASTGDMDLDMLCDRVYARVLDLAKDKHILQTAQNETAIDKFLSQSEISMEDENRRAYPPSSILTNNNIVYGILKHTCLNCSKSFEQARHLRRHFILEHIVHKPTYKCDYCEASRGSSMDNVYDLDAYLVHTLSLHNNLHENLENLYDLFVLKYTQDIFCDYFMNGHFFIEAQQMKHINKLKFGKENCTLIQKMHSKIFENYFINDDNGSFISDPNEPLTCKPPVMLTSKSIKSNLLYSQITKASIFKEIVEYLKVNPAQMTHDALQAYRAVQVVQPLVASLPVATSSSSANTPSLTPQQQPNCPDNIKYNQCKFCMKIFKECNAYKEHLMEIHTFNEFCNRCIVCPYCKQLMKSNFESNVNANVLLNNHIRKCSSLKADISHVFNCFRNTAENDFGFLNSQMSHHQTSIMLSQQQQQQQHAALINSHHNSVDDSSIVSQPITPQPQIEVASIAPPPPPAAVATTTTTYQQQVVAEIPLVTNGKKRDFEELLQLKNRNLTIKKVKLTNPLRMVKLAEPKKCVLCDFKPDLTPNCMNKHLVDEHLTIKCVVCDELIIEKQLTSHLNDIHMPESKEICFACPYEPQSEDCKHHLELSEFMRHVCLVERLSDGNFKQNKLCPICGEHIQISDSDLAINNLSSLEKHFLQRHAVAMYNCELCTASFRDSWFLIEHILLEHKDDQTNTRHLRCLKCLKIIQYFSDDSLLEHAQLCAANKHRQILLDEHQQQQSCVSTPNDDHHNHGLVNSNLFLNPLSILSNVSTSVPHILSVGSLIDESNIMTTSEMTIERSESLNGSTNNLADNSTTQVANVNTSTDQECIQQVKLGEENFESIENETIITSDMITTTSSASNPSNEFNADRV